MRHIISLAAVSCLMVLLFVGTAGADWLSLGPDGGRLDAGCVSPHDPNTIYVAPFTSGSVTRVHRSTDAGVTWEALGAVPNAYNPYVLLADPNHDSLLYLVASGNRFMRSTDAGVTWSYTTMPIYTYYGALDPAVPGRIYVCGYNSTVPRHPSFSRSEDYGLTWSPMVYIDTLLENQYAYTVAGDNGQVYVGANFAGLFRSTDAGETWASAAAGITPTTNYHKALRIDPDDVNTVLLASSGGIFRTANAGDTWVKTGTVMSYFMNFSTADPDIGYAGYNYVYRTTDRGLTWTRPLPGLRMRYLKGFGPHPMIPELVFSWGSSGVFKSADSGTNWVSSHEGLRASTIGTIAVSPDDADRLYLDMDDCGMFYSLNGGASWDTCSYFLSCGGICDIGIVPGADSDILFALEGSG